MARKLSGGISGDPNVSSIQVASDAVMTAAADVDITLSPAGTGIVIFDTNTQVQGSNDLRFADSDSSNYIGFKAPASVSANLIWTLPAVDGSDTQVLSTNGSGDLSWATPGITVTNETSSATTHYVAITTASTGSITGARVTTTKLTFQPSTGTLSSTLSRVTANTSSTSRTTGALVVTGGVGVGGAIYAGSDIVAYASSDIRLKEDISKIDNSLEKLFEISGYEYFWNKTAQEMFPERTMRDVGVIAQEVKKVLPSAVVERDDGYLAVNYEKIIPLLIESVKTLKQELDMIKRGT